MLVGKSCNRSVTSPDRSSESGARRTPLHVAARTICGEVLETFFRLRVAFLARPELDSSRWKLLSCGAVIFETDKPDSAIAILKRLKFLCPKSSQLPQFDRQYSTVAGFLSKEEPRCQIRRCTKNTMCSGA